MAGIGHNNGPTLERGTAWRTHCWRRSRQSLLPKLPLPVIKRRLRRALDLGLDYPSYATVRASTGRDIVALVFSENALRLDGAGRVDASRGAHLRRLRDCDPVVAFQSAIGAGLEPKLADQDLSAIRLGAAPIFMSTEAERRSALDALRGRLPGDAVLVIGETAFERSWVVTGRLAGYLAAERYFAPRG